jgi:hypothetical protein
MYIVNNICYAGNKSDEIKIAAAKALRGGILLVTFSSGEQKLFDTTLLSGSAFEPLRNEDIFQQFSIFHGILTWLNGEIDIAPETVYEMSYPYESNNFKQFCG